MLLAERLPGREEFGGAVTNLLGEAERAGADIVTRTPVDGDLVREQMPDIVVVATGARPRRPPIEVLGSPDVLDAWEVIEGAELPPGKVVVADWKADWVGAGVARALAERRHRVVLAVDGYAACERLQQYVRDAHLAALARSHIEVLPLVRLFGVDDDCVYLQHVLTKEPVIVEGVSGLVLAEGHEPVDCLLSELTRPGSGVSAEVVGIGDCMAPRSVEEAVLDGLVVASRI